MARLQILELPEGSNDERPPFLLVVDQVGGDAAEAIANAGLTTAELIGARAVLVFEDTIDIPANDTTADLGREDGGDGSDEGWMEADKAHADVVDWLKVRDKDRELRAANEWIERLGAEAREARGFLARVRALHQPQPDGTGTPEGQQCRTCSQDGGDGYQYLVPWPCPTVRTLDGEQPAADA